MLHVSSTLYSINASICCQENIDARDEVTGELTLLDLEQLPVSTLTVAYNSIWDFSHLLCLIITRQVSEMKNKNTLYCLYVRHSASPLPALVQTTMLH